MSIFRSSFPISMCSLLLIVASSGSALAQQAPVAEEDIRGVKPLVEIAKPQASSIWLWASIAAAVLVAALIIFLWRKWLAKKRPKSPSELALSALASLESDREAMTAEVFAYLTTKTVRDYIAARFGVAAPRQTTEEFLQALAKGQASDLLGQTESLQTFLKACDLAKFAGTHLDSTQRGNLLEAARAFIQGTSNAIPQP
jgi:Domain of unknown function (DUF4381)